MAAATACASTAFAGQTVLKPTSELASKVGASESRLQMRGSKAKAVSGSIWYVVFGAFSRNGCRSLPLSLQLPLSRIFVGVSIMSSLCLLHWVVVACFSPSLLFSLSCCCRVLAGLTKRFAYSYLPALFVAGAFFCVPRRSLFSII